MKKNKDSKVEAFLLLACIIVFAALVFSLSGCQKTNQEGATRYAAVIQDGNDQMPWGTATFCFRSDFGKIHDTVFVFSVEHPDKSFLHVDHVVFTDTAYAGIDSIRRYLQDNNGYYLPEYYSYYGRILNRSYFAIKSFNRIP